MQPYQNYFPQMNNGYNLQFQNPYQQRMDFLQNYQQSLQQPVQQIPQQGNQMNVLGKIVDSVEMVKSMDIPMDGMLYYFPKADGTEVYGKQWLSNGQTRILTFKPILESEPNNSSQTEEKMKLGVSEDFTSTVLEKLDGLDNRINELLLQSSTKTLTKTVKSSTKKESEAE